MKVAFVDRDGTIVRDYPDDVWAHIQEPEFLFGSIAALCGFRKLGYEIVLLTNQYLIHDGIITMMQYESFTDKMVRTLSQNGVELLDIFFCPHSKSEGCRCYKPNTGLVEMAVQKYPAIDLCDSFIAGDSESDVELGNRLGIKAFGIDVKSDACGFIRVNALYDVLSYL